ncbi:MAG: hypothetical protein GXP58_11120 [Deltaproteobacteria bacterium]|nr:hypothetical protein [Deltaproteobacteria bacterium]
MKERHAEWRDSVHSRMGVTCNNCHGGNPGKESKKAAHEGVYDSMNPKSSVYYTNIPRLCGRCHKHEFLEFKMSVHYRMLMTKGVGPNCVTCHDAMSTKVLRPTQLELFCGICHNTKMSSRPGILNQAKEVLLKMNRISRKVDRTETKLHATRARGCKISKAEGFLHLAQHELIACRQDWHTFKLARIEKRLNGVETLLHEGLATLPSGWRTIK